jgi:hypothetical protein
MATLNPCHKCGNPAEEYEEERLGFFVESIICSNLDCPNSNPTGVFYSTVDEAAEAWNKANPTT